MCTLSIQDAKRVAFECIRNYEENSSVYYLDIVKQALSHFYSSLLNAEFLAHLGYEKSSSATKESPNRRNGFIHKKVRSSFGPLDVMVPRDRDGSFSPIAVRKHSRAVTSTESKVLSMYAQGMNESDVQICIQKIYGYELPESSVNTIYERVLSDIRDTGAGNLKDQYAFACMSRIDFKLRRAAPQENDMSLYIVQGVDGKGNREILNCFLSPPNRRKTPVELLRNLELRGVRNIAVLMCLGMNMDEAEAEEVFPYSSLYCPAHSPRFNAGTVR